MPTSQVIVCLRHIMPGRDLVKAGLKRPDQRWILSTMRRETGGLPPEQQAIQDKCFHPTGTFIQFRKDEIEQSVPERFEDQVRRHPNRLEVKTRSHQLTYEELNRAANRISNLTKTPK